MTDRITLETKGAKAIIEQFETTPKRMERATRLAANAALSPVRTPVKRIMASKVGVAQKHFARRFTYRSAKEKATERRENFSRLWIGLNPIGASQRVFGKLKQDDYGAWAKKYYFPDAFVASLRGPPSTAIYKRVGRSRFPVRRQTVVVDSPEIRAAIDANVDKAQEKYLREVERLLKVDWDKVKQKAKRRD